jgi:hypothetical protein
MSDTPAVYRIIQRLHVNQWSDDLGRAVPGWEIKALWNKTGTVLPIFLPDSSYTAENVDTLLRAAGARDEQIHELGG